MSLTPDVEPGSGRLEDPAREETAREIASDLALDWARGARTHDTIEEAIAEEGHDDPDGALAERVGYLIETADLAVSFPGDETVPVNAGVLLAWEVTIRHEVPVGGEDLAEAAPTSLTVGGDGLNLSALLRLPAAPDRLNDYLALLERSYTQWSLVGRRVVGARRQTPRLIPAQSRVAVQRADPEHLPESKNLFHPGGI